MRKLKQKAAKSPAVTLPKVRPIDPRIVELKHSMAEIRDYPSAFQLAQLTAQLVRPEDFQDNAMEAAVLRARRLWDAVAEILKKEMAEKIGVLEKQLEASSRLDTAQMSPAEKECRDVCLNGTFPIDFEHALKLFLGRKIRLSDRYKAFRDFLIDLLGFSPLSKNQDTARSWAANMIEAQKRDGFSKEVFGEVAQLFFEWKKMRSHARAQKAAEKRWNRKVVRSLFDEPTNFSTWAYDLMRRDA